MKPEIELIADAGTACGEAPTWDAGRDRIVWVDNETDRVFAFDLATGSYALISDDLLVKGIALNGDGRYVFAGKGIRLWRGPGDVETIADTAQCGGATINDVVAAPSGGLYFGTTYWGPDGMEKAGELQFLTPDGEVSILDEGILMANGLGVSPDEKTLYFADSPARKVYAYDLDPKTGSVSNRRTFVDIPREDGIPDGLTVDAEGFVLCAMWYGAQIVRHDPEGKVERRIEMPVKQVSSLLFGGRYLTDIYVTTAKNLWPSEYEPPGFDRNAVMGGGLYRVRVDGLRGKPEYRTRF